MKAHILFVAIMCLYTAVDGYGRTITVDANGSGDYTTIQAAIDDANNTDIVQVWPGTYQETINFLGKNITVTGLDPEDPCVIAATVIDANGLGSVVTFNHSETNEAVLTGFTITGGTGTFVFEVGGIEVYWGGGICCEDSSPAIVRNVIVGNHGPVEMDGNTPVVVSFGGGIVSMAGEPTITQNIIKDNSAYFGAAVAVISGDAKIVSNLIYENSAWIGGGAAPMFGGQLLANTIVENNSLLGGGVCLLSDTVIGKGLVSGNIICDSTQGGGLYADSNSLDVVWYNNLHNNTPADYIETPNLNGIGGNISTDPCFADTVDDDFHLLPTSPCIDAGDPNYIPEPNETDLDGNPRVNGGRIDMGAYESIMHEARLLILPRVINRKSRQPRIMAWLHLPQGITKDQIDKDVPLILYPGGIKAVRQFVFQNRRRDGQRTSVFAFFDKAELMDAIETNGRVQLMVLGQLLEPGQYFYGSDTIRIIAPRPPRWPPYHRRR